MYVENKNRLKNEIKDLNDKHLCLWDERFNTDNKDVNSLYPSNMIFITISNNILKLIWKSSKRIANVFFEKQKGNRRNQFT